MLDGVTLASGTSFAAPIVAGAAAWLATARPTSPTASSPTCCAARRATSRRPATTRAPASASSTSAPRSRCRRPARDVLEPNDGITFVNGSVFAQARPVRLARQRQAHPRRQRRPGRGPVRRLPHPAAQALARADPAAPGRSATPTSSSSAAARGRSTRTTNIVARSRKHGPTDRLRDDPQHGPHGAAFYVGDRAGRRGHRPQRLVQPAVSAAEVPLSAAGRPRSTRQGIANVSRARRTDAERLSGSNSRP